MINNVPRIKYVKEISILYWFGKRLDIDIYWRMNDDGSKKQLALTIWKCHQIKDLPYEDNEYYSSWWKHFTLWTFKKS